MLPEKDILPLVRGELGRMEVKLDGLADLVKRLQSDLNRDKTRRHSLVSYLNTMFYNLLEKLNTDDPAGEGYREAADLLAALSGALKAAESDHPVPAVFWFLRSQGNHTADMLFSLLIVAYKTEWGTPNPAAG